MALERVYNVPLRKEFQKAPKYKRAKKAVIALREFLAKHMKAELEKVKIGEYANLAIWKRGIQYPPHHVKIRAVKQDDGIVQAELVGAPEKKVEEKKVKKAKAEVKEEKETVEGKAEIAEKAEYGKIAEKPKRLGKKALQKELQATQQKVEEVVEELKEKVEEKLEEKQEEAKKIEQEEIKEMQHELEKAKRHKPKVAREDRSQRNKKKEMIPGRKDK